MIKLVVGLGNPGAKYDMTRHNIGFMVIDKLAEAIQLDFRNSDKFSGLVATHEGEERIYFLKPTTYMNLSGNSVYSLASYFKVSPSEIMVIHDEMNIDYGRVKLKVGGSAGGHNGISSMIQQLSASDFLRLKMGIGRRSDGGDVTGHVLGKFAPEEKKHLDEFLELGAKAVMQVFEKGVLKAMNDINRL